MPKTRRRFLGLCLLPILLTCLDNGLTLSGQPKEYWAGNYAKAVEGNQWHFRLLAYHPLALVAEEVASMLVFVGLILLMPLLELFIFGYVKGRLTGNVFQTEPNGVIAKCPSKYEAASKSAGL